MTQETKTELGPAERAAYREALEAAEQCMADFIEVYRRGGTMLVFDEAVKSMRSDGLAKVRATLGREWHQRDDGGDDAGQIVPAG